MKTTIKQIKMTTSNLKSKLTKLNVIFTENNSTILFSLNNKGYEAHVTISGNVCGYCTDNYSKFEGRTFDNLNQVIKHANR